MNFDLITVLGPTAVGKTKLAVQIANHFNGEIISADSRQVYKGMDIGTGKDLNDYYIDGQKIKYHLIDVISPKNEFNLFLFKEFFFRSYRSIKEKNKIPVLAGGTGLYLSSVLQNYNLEKVSFDEKKISELNGLSIVELRKKLLSINSELHNTTDLIDKQRIIKAIIVATQINSKINGAEKINSINIGVVKPREEIKKNIEARLKQRLNNGMVEEVEKLMNEGIDYDKMKFFGLEYKFIAMYLKNEINYNDMFQKLRSAINAFAKRQMTWFRKMEKERIKIHWIDGPDFEQAKKIINNYL
ncbi:MAG: tRNA (adenosine(37)-N6)-dimethylallyltransferase MiaA [Ignavibacteria bacterium]|jgi:tRNA dimethylallyltransferase